MPIFWTEETREGKNGVHVPYMEVHVGDLTLVFHGRPGARLPQAVREAVRHLERKQRGEGGDSHGADERAAGAEES